MLSCETAAAFFLFMPPSYIFSEDVEAAKVPLTPKKRAKISWERFKGGKFMRGLESWKRVETFIALHVSKVVPYLCKIISTIQSLNLHLHPLRER